MADRPPGFTREQLLKAAADVFAEAGFEKASVQAIAARAGVTSATIYRHFASKADVLLGVVDEAIHALPLTARLEGEDVLSVAELTGVVSQYAESTLATLRRLAIEIHAAASHHPEAKTLLLAFNRRVHRNLAQRLEQSMEAGQIPSTVDVDRIASLLVVIIMGLTHLETLDPRLVGDRAWIRFLEATLGDLLRRGEGRAS